MPARRDQAFRRSAPERAAGAEGRARWQARHAEVWRHHWAGETLLGIARETGRALGTVRKHARAEAFPARTPNGPGPSIFDPCLAHLDRRLAQGCKKGLALWRELRGPGVPGGTRPVRRWLTNDGQHRPKPGRTTGASLAHSAPARVAAGSAPPAFHP